MDCAQRKGLRFDNQPIQLCIFNNHNWSTVFDRFKDIDFVMFINSKQNAATKQGHGLFIFIFILFL